MASILLSTALVYTSHSYRIQLSNRETVGNIAEYLSQYEPHIQASTLEIARPVAFDQQLRDIDIQAGDRLLVFTQPTNHAELPAQLNPGDKILKLATENFETDSRGKTSLLLGKTDSAQQIAPDIDLRYFIPPDSLEFISRKCLALQFDDRSKLWYASRLGHTRIMLDELELGTGQVPLSDGQYLRFYRATDTPRQPASQPLGEIHLTIESIQSRKNTTNLQTGQQFTNIYVASEQDTQTLKASENLPLQQLAMGLAHHHNIPLTADAYLYLVRLVLPTTTIGQLNLSDREFLYTARNHHQTHNALLLHDIHDRNRIYMLSAGLDNQEKRIGCRSSSGDITLDIDLYDALIIRGHATREFQNIAGYQGLITYKTADNTWWIRLDENARTALFVNNLRLTSNTLIQLTSGDVLTLGPSVNHYYARLEIEITAKDVTQPGE